MFQFPGLPSLKLCIGLRISQLFNCDGLPHSDTPGSLPVYDSPRRFAVFCVLLLLYMPRHPPYALFRLITFLRLRTFFINYCYINRLSFVIFSYHNFSERPFCYVFLKFVFSFQRTAIRPDTFVSLTPGLASLSMVEVKERSSLKTKQEFNLT